LCWWKSPRYSERKTLPGEVEGRIEHGVLEQVEPFAKKVLEACRKGQELVKLVRKNGK